MDKEELYESGNTAPISGQYEVLGPKKGSKHREITMVKGKKFPPLKDGEKFYKLVDKTKHKNG